MTLAQACDKIERGIDPRAERKAARAALIAAARRGLTFAEAMDRYLDSKLEAFGNSKHKAQWRSTLETYAKPDLGKMLVSDIQVQDALRVLQRIGADRTETASRLRGRIEAVLSWATVSGHRTGDNPARWVGNLKELLPAPAKVAKGDNHPALNLDDAPAWFAALTAARSGEVRGAVWAEVDLEKVLRIILDRLGTSVGVTNEPPAVSSMPRQAQ